MLEMVAIQAPGFVIAFGVALVVGRAWVVLLAGLVIAFVSAVFVAVGARGDDNSWFDFSPSEAFTVALLLGGFLYAGWALGVVAATSARFWSARRRAARSSDSERLPI
jgi:energy-converting hydrogenase Eha subunit G